MNPADLITPLILTFNEAPNIGRTLERLQWAKQVLVIDSNSTDETEQIVAGFPQAKFMQRAFDNHANQWNSGIEHVSTPWILALDADFQVPQDFVEELSQLPLDKEPFGYKVSFIYSIYGRHLRSSALPVILVLFRKDKAHYRNDGHTQRLHLDGTPGHMRSRLIHDDRKSLTRWLQSQDRYMMLEVQKLTSAPQGKLSKADRIRKGKVLAPLVMGIYCLFVKRAILDGWPGWYYTCQRMLAELILVLRLLETEKLHTVPPQTKK